MPVLWDAGSAKLFARFDYAALTMAGLREAAQEVKQGGTFGYLGQL